MSRLIITFTLYIHVKDVAHMSTRPSACRRNRNAARKKHTEKLIFIDYNSKSSIDYNSQSSGIYKR